MNCLSLIITAYVILAASKVSFIEEIRVNLTVKTQHFSSSNLFHSFDVPVKIKSSFPLVGMYLNLSVSFSVCF